MPSKAIPESERRVAEVVALLEDHQVEDRPAFCITALGDIIHVTPRFEAGITPIVVTWEKGSKEYRLTMAGQPVPVRCSSAETAFECIRATFFPEHRPLKFG